MSLNKNSNSRNSQQPHVARDDVTLESERKHDRLAGYGFSLSYVRVFYPPLLLLSTQHHSSTQQGCGATLQISTLHLHPLFLPTQRTIVRSTTGVPSVVREQTRPSLQLTIRARRSRGMYACWQAHAPSRNQPTTYLTDTSPAFAYSETAGEQQQSTTSSSVWHARAPNTGAARCVSCISLSPVVHLPRDLGTTFFSGSEM